MKLTTIPPERKRYSEKYDAIFDAETLEWLERKCPDEKNCDFCLGRPERAELWMGVPD